ncbi:MAG TPA: hypothetical protein VIM93_07040 [Kangiella sp.]|uniref:hypothetical protein n=1 Tax=Kangiella sp. TaxID=1920245 RepID=UPI002F92176B
MLKAIAVTFLIFAILFAGIISLKRSANLWRVPKGVKAQPYEDDDNENEKQQKASKSNNQGETPQLEDQSDSKQKTDSQEKH